MVKIGGLESLLCVGPSHFGREMSVGPPTPACMGPNTFREVGPILHISLFNKAGVIIIISYVDFSCTVH